MPVRIVARTALWLSAVTVCAAVAACAPSDSGSSGSRAGGASSSGSVCDHPPTVKSGVLTIATDSPAYPPWFAHNDPTNGKGYESAVAYAVAQKMGFPRAKVNWTTEPFNASYQPGPKKFDFDINQISITPKRAQAVTFSHGYYTAAQAIIVMKNSPYADATSLSDFKDATLGAQVGTTSLDAITNVVKPNTQPQVFDDTNAAKNALQNGQVDGIVADLPTAFYITGAEITSATIVGQFQPQTGQQEQFGLLFEKGNPLVKCANQAIDRLRRNGTLDRLQHRWLNQVADVPRLD